MASFDFQMGILGHLYNLLDKEKMVNDIIKHDLIMTQSMFKYDGLPDTLKSRTMEKNMQMNGWTTVTAVNGQLYAFNSSLGGMPDADYLPTISVVANPGLNFNKELKIHDECVVIPNTTYYESLLPMLRKFATQEVENTISMYVADINARVQAFLSAQDEDTKKSAEMYLDNLVKGKLGVIAETSFFDNAIKVNPNGTNIGANITNLIELQQFIESKKLAFLCLNSNYNMKREAIGSNESALNTDVLSPFIDDMMKMRQEGVDEINALYGTSITVDFDSAWKSNKIEEELELEALASDPEGEGASDQEESTEETPEEDKKEEDKDEDN